MSQFKTVESIPTVERQGRGSKYAEVFEAVEKAAPKAIVAAEFSEGKDDEENRSLAANRASYLREVAPEGVTIAQRGNQVFAQKVSTNGKAAG